MKKKIMFVIYNIASGGTEQLLINFFSNSCFSEKYELFLLYSGDYDEGCYKKLQNCKFNIIRINYNVRNKRRCIKEIYDVIREKNIDIIHINLGIDSYLPLIAAKMAKIKVRILHIHTKMLVADDKKTKIKRIFQKFLIKKLSNEKIACSDAAAQSYGLNNFEKLYNGIDANKFVFNKDDRKRMIHKMGLERRKIVGYIARYESLKNHTFIVDVMENIIKEDRSVILLFIGTGKLKDELIFRINKYGIQDNVIMIEPQYNISDYYQMMDLFVFPSISEGLGMVAIESQLNKLYCIASENVPKETKISDLIEYLPLEVDIWRDRIKEHLLKDSREKNIDSVVDGEKFDIEKQSYKLFQFYNKLVKKYRL